MEVIDLEKISKDSLLKEIFYLKNQIEGFEISLSKQLEINSYYRTEININKITKDWIDKNIVNYPCYISIAYYNDSKHSMINKKINEEKELYELSKSFCFQKQIRVITKDDYEFPF